MSVTMKIIAPTSSRPDSPDQRFLLAIAAAIFLHLVAIWQIHFKPPQPRPLDPFTSMEVILVQPSHEAEPQEADYLAQTSQEGSGSVETKVRPTSAGAAAPAPPPPPPPTPAAEVEPPPQVPDLVVMTAHAPPRTVSKPTPTPGPATPPAPPQLSGAELARRGLNLSFLEADPVDSIQAGFQRKRQLYISAATREYVAASYMDAWRTKVEKVGNFNYPLEARKRRLYGSLILDVALLPDGSIDDITVVHSSGHKVLDDAAINIVRLASPYAPFPKKLRDRTDILHITRTWQFRRGDQLTSR